MRSRIYLYLRIFMYSCFIYCISEYKDRFIDPKINELVQKRSNSQCPVPEGLYNLSCTDIISTPISSTQCEFTANCDTGIKGQTYEQFKDRPSTCQDKLLIKQDMLLVQQKFVLPAYIKFHNLENRGGYINNALDENGKPKAIYTAKSPDSPLKYTEFKTFKTSNDDSDEECRINLHTSAASNKGPSYLITATAALAALKLVV